MLYNEDCLETFKKIGTESVDLIFADPPYFLSNGGKSIRNGKVVSVNKGEWDKKNLYENHLKFTQDWIDESYRILKKTGVIWISGTIHNTFDVKTSLEKAGFKIVNVVIWHKTTPPPLIYKNKFRFSYEFIILAKKLRNYTFNYSTMYEVENCEMEDVWNISAVGYSEKRFGYHPTQKPKELIERIILSTSKENDVILDPFMGSGTTGVVAKKYSRQFIGIEKEKNYFKLAKTRIEQEK